MATGWFVFHPAFLPFFLLCLPEAACMPQDSQICYPGTRCRSIGQAIYVAENGALRFSAYNQNVKNRTRGFFDATIGNTESGLGAWTFSVDSPNETLPVQWLACPSARGRPFWPYQIYAGLPGLQNRDVPGKSVDACIGFDALTLEYNATSPAAGVYL